MSPHPAVPQHVPAHGSLRAAGSPKRTWLVALEPQPRTVADLDTAGAVVTAAGCPAAGRV